MEEDDSEAIHAAVEQAEQTCTHLIAYAELRAALAKAQRMQRLDGTQKAQLLPIIDNDWQTLNVILPTEMLVKRVSSTPSCLSLDPTNPNSDKKQIEARILALFQYPKKEFCDTLLTEK